jgi:hypothetical protein
LACLPDIVLVEIRAMRNTSGISHRCNGKVGIDTNKQHREALRRHTEYKTTICYRVSTPTKTSNQAAAWLSFFPKPLSPGRTVRKLINVVVLFEWADLAIISKVRRIWI